ncbi:MAG TPA: ComEC/Rec2 family competence protein, partial [Segetibacter sp.]
MPEYSQPYFWKRMPFVRLLIPLITGILIQYLFHFSSLILFALAAFAVLPAIIFQALSFSSKYSKRWLPGLSVNLFIAAAGALIFHLNDIKNNKNWAGHYTGDSIAVLATIKEPLVEKAKSYKAEVDINALNIKGEWKEVTAKALVYFSKDSSKPALNYGSQVIFFKALQPIRNSGNPGAFDYAQYSAFQQIYHQVFLKQNEYKITPAFTTNPFKRWLFTVRKSVIDILQL